MVDDPDFLKEVRVKGEILKNALGKLAEGIPGAEVRGEGLLIGVELGPNVAPRVFEHCLQNGLLVNLIGGATIRLAPPLTVSKTEIRYALGFFRSGVSAVRCAQSEPGMALSA